MRQRAPDGSARDGSTVMSSHCFLPSESRATKSPRVGEYLTQIAPNHVDQLLGGFSPLGLRVFFGVGDMKSNVILQELRHQTVDSAAAGGELLEDSAAIALLLEEALDAADLATKAADPVHEFGLIAN